MRYVLDTTVVVFAFRRIEEMSADQTPTWRKTHAWLESLGSSASTLIRPKPSASFCMDLRTKSESVRPWRLLRNGSRSEGLMLTQHVCTPR